MNRARAFGALPHVRYRPEVTACLHCGATLAYSHPVWAKPIQFLDRTEHLTNLGYRCPDVACVHRRTVYRSAQAEACQVKGSGYGLDVVVRIGHLRFSEHRTRAEIWQALQHDTPVRISERHVQNLIEVYLALLRASRQDLRQQVASVVAEHGGIVLSLDGLQPEQGNEQLWIVREVLSGAILGAVNLQQATAPVLAQLLRPIQEVELPVLGVISDAQESIRLAVATVFPQVPHQLCQYHALREAAEPLWEADRHLLVEAKKELRGLRDVEERVRERSDPNDATSGVILDTVLALRQTVRERGTLPFEFAGLRVMAALADLGQTLDRCLAKRGMRTWRGCGCWSAVPRIGARRAPPSCGRPIPTSWLSPGCSKRMLALKPPRHQMAWQWRRDRRHPVPRCVSEWRPSWRRWTRRSPSVGWQCGSRRR
jgi:hypothetical protein